MVRVLAFFDTRYQSSADMLSLTGTADPWARLREARPASRQHFALNQPSTLGMYDLADPQAAARVVAMARGAGIDGFVVDCRWAGGTYVTGAQVLAPATGESFGLAFQWRNGDENFWREPADRETRAGRAAALMAALKAGQPTAVAGRTLLIVDRPKELAEPAETLALLRSAAAGAGLPGLYLVANRAEDKGRFLSAGFDALIDPGPAEWHSCGPSNRPTGLDFLEVMAGLKDSVEYLDKFFPYLLFAVSRMINREQRGKVLPRVFPAFHDWAFHPEGGATHLVAPGNKAVDTYWYGLFVENAMLHTHEHFTAGEQIVFLDSWNGWLEGSQVEPSLLDGDLVYNATRDAIDRGRYVIRTREGLPEGGLAAEMRERIRLLCDAARSIS